MLTFSAKGEEVSMADKIPKGPSEKTDRLVPRRSTEKRGGYIEPEGVSPSGPSPFRTRHVRGIPQEPPTPDFESRTRNKQGSHLENDIRSDFVTPPVVGPMGDSKSMQNPAK
jgi:hypothetical protein